MNNRFAFWCPSKIDSPQLRLRTGFVPLGETASSWRRLAAAPDLRQLNSTDKKVALRYPFRVRLWGGIPSLFWCAWRVSRCVVLLALIGVYDVIFVAQLFIDV